MLRFMRKHASRWLLGIICAIIIVVFVFTFGFNKGGPDKTIAQVGAYKISAAEFYQAQTRLENFYRNLYRDKFDDETRSQLKLKEATMGQLVDKYLMLTKADDMGIRISDKEFQAYLAGIEPFKKNGVFNEEAYMYFLKRNNLDPKTFEDSEKQAMTIDRVMRIIGDNGVRQDDNAARDAYLREKGQIKLAAAVFDPDSYKDKVDIDEKQLSAIYDREKEAHRSENMYHLRYMLVTEKSGVRDDQAYMELLKTKDMLAYGKSKGLEVTDLGMLKESDLMAKFANLKVKDWLKGLGKGEISLPVRSGDRSFIFQIVDRQDGKPLEKAEALKEIRASLAAEKAKVAARVKAEDAIKAKDARFGKDTPLMSRNMMMVQGIGQIPKEDSGVLALSKGGIYGKPVSIGGKYYVFKCTDEKQPDSAQWDKDKATYLRIHEAMAKEAYLSAFREGLKKSTKVKIDWNEI